MRIIAFIVAMLPLTVALAEDEQVELPRTIERLFDKSADDNREAVERVVVAIRERNDRLIRDVEEQIQRSRALREAKETYDTLVSNGISDKQILETANADVKAVAAIYMRMNTEVAKGPEDYLTDGSNEDAAKGAARVKTKPEIIATNTWTSGSWTDSFNPDGSVNINGRKTAKTWEVDGEHIVVKVNGVVEQTWILQDDGTVLMTRTNGGPMTWNRVEE